MEISVENFCVDIWASRNIENPSAGKYVLISKVPSLKVIF